VADKMMEDDETFKMERSRMAVLYSLLDDDAAQLLESRYSSDENPFRSLAEMVATLAAIYHDNTQGSRARDELRNLVFDPSDKATDIHKFISRVNRLCDKANVAKKERKITLYEHLPANLNPQLLDYAEDEAISYEVFTVKVANAVRAQQRSYLERREKRAGRAKSPTQRTTTPRTTTTKVVEGGQGKAKLDPAAQEALKKENRCFICKEEGHIAKKCPRKKVIAAALADPNKKLIAAVIAASQDVDSDTDEEENSSTTSSDSKN